MSISEVDLEVHSDPARHYAWAAATSGFLLVRFSVIVYGWAVTETTGTASASVDLYDADAATGRVVLPVRVASGESAESWYGDRGIWFRNGIYINVTSGSVQGTVFYRHHRG